MNKPGIIQALLISVSLLSFIQMYCQSKSATVKVICLDMENKAIEGEQVVFIREGSRAEFKGITDQNGYFAIDIPGPGKYLILAKSISQNTEGGNLVLPILKSGQSYGTYEVEVRIEPAMEFTLNNVYYESASQILKQESFKELDELYNLLLYKQSIKIEIAGHTDDVGDENANLQLSKNRAESVKAYLVGKGIAGERILTKGYGESMPIADNSNEEGRKINRRTEVRIVE